MNSHPIDPGNGGSSTRFKVKSSPLADLSDRLVTLCDGRLGLRSGLHVEVVETSKSALSPSAPRDPLEEREERRPFPASASEVHGAGQQEGVVLPIRENSRNSCPASGQNPSNSCLDFIASDETLDRTDEIISATGWRLEAYRRNPVFQN